MLRNLIIYNLLLFLIFSAYENVCAEVYRCLDNTGKVKYMNTPCPEDQKGEVVIDDDRSDEEYDDSYYYENESYKQFIEVENIKKISSGERVNINRFLAKNKITAFLFYADWCHSCKKVKPQVEDFARSSDNFVLREIDITEFESPVTNQYGIKSIPYFLVYDESGNLAAKGSANRIFNYLNGRI